MKCTCCDKDAEYSTRFSVGNESKFMRTCERHNKQLLIKLEDNKKQYRNGKICLFCGGSGRKDCCNYKGIRE